MLTPERMIFKGAKLSDTDIPRIGHQIKVGEDIMHATIDTETAGRWTDSKGRLPMLYEPHVAFRAATSNAVRDKLVKAGLAYPKWGTKPYPKDSYPRFWKAYEIDPETACRACSWGGPQILGEEYAKSKYPSAVKLVEGMLESEANQLQAMVDFIVSKKLDDDLRTLQAKLNKGQKVTPDDCRPFVRGYNGSGYEKNDYHTTYAKNLNKWVKIPDTPWTPDGESAVDLYDGKVHEELKGIQTTLDEIGYPEVGTIDGRWGTRTAAAVMAFRLDNGLQTTDPRIDAEFLTRLALKPQRPVAPARANATLDTLRKEDDVAVKQTDQTKLFGQITTAGGGVFGVKKVLDEFGSSSDTVRQIIDTLNPAQTFITDNFWLILLGVGGFVVWKSGILNRIRLEKHQTGQDVSA